MKKTVLLIFLSAFSIIGAKAQDTISNNHFERWVPSGKPAPFDWQEPEGWTTTNALTEFIGAAVTKTQYPNTSSFQAKIKTLNVFGNPVPGLLINGDFTLNASDTDKIPLLGGEPYNASLKQKLYGLYNFTATDTTDSATVVVAFKWFNNTTQQTEAVASGAIHLGDIGAGLHPFVIDIAQHTFATPDSVVITMVSGTEGNFKFGGELIVDYVSFTAPVSVKTVTNRHIALYPNPATAQLFVFNLDDPAQYSIFDIAGKQLLSGTTTGTTGIDINTLETGFYLLHIDGAVARFVKE